MVPLLPASYVQLNILIENCGMDNKNIECALVSSFPVLYLNKRNVDEKIEAL